MIQFLQTLADLFIHLDIYLATLIDTYGAWVYVFVFAVIFLETGLVITPFLPGDSLLFAAGTLAAVTALQVYWLWPLVLAAAILGDTVNYWLGHRLGLAAFQRYPRWFKPKHLERTQNFYARYGNKTIVLARFVPIIRTVAPFVAGIGRMDYPYFLGYNILGGFIWTTLFTFGGYFFGNVPLVKNNFEWVILMIIAISLLPAAIGYWRHRSRPALISL